MVLNLILEDSTSPGNVVQAAERAIGCLQYGDPTSAKKVLEGVMTDDLPGTARVRVWNVLQLLEKLAPERY